MSKRDLTHTRNVTAHHEAGHAVVSWKLGLKFKKVTIAQEEGCLGHVLYERLPQWFNLEDGSGSARSQQFAERLIVSDFAGQLAEKKFRGRNPRFGMHSDNQSAVELAYRLHNSQDVVSAYLRYCWQVSRGWVDRLWPEAQRVAAALLERETLLADDVVNPGSIAFRKSLTAYKNGRGRKAQGKG